MISGVRHAGQILDLFTSSEPEWGAAEVGRSVGISRSHAHRLLATLAEIGLLDRIEKGGRFRLSWMWFEYARVIRASDPLVASGVPIMRKLRTSHGLDSLLAVWRRGAVLSFSDEAASGGMGRERSVCPAMRLVLMAGLPDDERKSHLASASMTAWFSGPEEMEEAIRRVQAGSVLVGPDADAPDGRWLVAPVIDGQSIVAALGVYARGEHCSDGHNAVAVVKMATASLTSSLHLSRGSES